VELKDPFENMGAKMVKEVASKTSDVAGDGTTTATILAEAIYEEGLKAVTAGVNPMALKRGVDRAVEVAVEELKKRSRKVSRSEEIAQVATISANNDPAVGRLLADAMDKVGKDGVITVEEGKSLETELDLVEGMQFDKGYVSPYFINKPETMECVLEDAYVLIHEKKVSAARDLVPILQKIIQTGKPLLIIAEDVLTDGQMISEDLGRKLESVELGDLGRAKRITVDRETVTFVQGEGKASEVQARINQIKTQIEQTTSDYDREKLEERLAKLAGGVAVINVGAATEAEMKERKGLVEDALHATRAAAEEGIVAGGGVALLRSIPAVQALRNRVRGEEKIGVDIIARALEEPLRQIAENSGRDGSVAVAEVRELPTDTGYDANSGDYVDMFQAGIIDPTKVTRSALQNAASIASLMLTTETAITEYKKEKEEPEIEAAIH